MKKVFLTAVAFALLVACNQNSSESSTTNTDTATTAATDDFTKDPAYAKGLEIEAKNDCGTCHKINEKLVGPAFHDVAVKYAGASEAQIDTLANKVIKGGAGNWGQVPMTPHPNLSHDDAKAVVKYILLLKNS